MADFIPPAHETTSPFADMRGHNVAARTLDLETAKRWHVETLDFRVDPLGNPIELAEVLA